MALRLNAVSASERVFGVRPEGVGVPKEVWLGGMRMRCTESPILVVRWGDRLKCGGVTVRSGGIGGWATPSKGQDCSRNANGEACVRLVVGTKMCVVFLFKH
jgi:hypothetical protein